MNAAPDTRFDPLFLSRIEDAGLNASAPSQQLWIDGWLVRLAPGKAKRGRCVNAVSAGRGPLESRLHACARVFERAGLPMIIRITPFTLPRELEAALDARGMRRFDETRVMVRQHLAGFGDPDDQPSGSTIRPVGLGAFAQRVGAFRNTPLAQRQVHAERMLNSTTTAAAFEMTVDGRVAACAMFTLENDVVGLSDVFTAVESRGRGYARLLCNHLLRDAARRGAQHAYLQVEADNAPARAVYRGLGFIDGYAYHYRSADPAAA